MVRLDAEVVHQLKLVAVARRTTVQALVERAVAQWCKRQPEWREAQKSA